MVSNSPVRNQLFAALLCAVMVSPLVSGQQKNDDGIRLHCKLLDAHATKIVRPTYPELARETRVEGRVSLTCIIGRDGSVQKIEVKKGHPLLIQAATDAVAQWKFKPLVLDGQAVEIETTVNIDFQLPKSQKNAVTGKVGYSTYYD
jgi:TonB family protein